MIPPLLYRVINPDADTEQAYILACKLVLPAGMVGLMVAAMASATASMATTRLNVYAGAFTESFKRVFKQDATEKQLVFVGRMVTIILGSFIIAGALMIPRYGYTKFIIDVNVLLYVPLFLPSIWGLFSKKIGVKAVWATTIAGFLTAYVVKFALRGDGFLTGLEMLQPLVIWIAENSRIADMLAGIISPFIILAVLELMAKKKYPGWDRAQEAKKAFDEKPVAQVYTLPGKMVAISLVFIAVLMAGLAIFNGEEAGILLTLTLVLLGIAGALFYFMRRADKETANACNEAT